MQRLIFVLVLFFICLVPVQAQEEYQLRDPDVLELLNLLPYLSSFCEWGAPQPFSANPWNICDYVMRQIETTYRDDLANLPYDILIEAYNRIQPDNGWNYRGGAFLWHKSLIMAWLRDNETDLDSETQFTIAQLDIFVEPRDFNADGVDEYILQIESTGFSTIFVVARQGDGTYNHISGSLPFQIDAPYSDRDSNYLHEIAFNDFNADGLPEWFLAFDGAVYRGDYLGEVLLLSWRDGELQPVDKYSIKYIPFFDTNANDLTQDDVEDGYLFANLDDDPALELQAINITADNWHCKQSSSIVYDWSPEEDAYIKIRESIKRENSANCVINDAETALYDGNYIVAPHLYKFALTLPFETLYESETDEFIKEMQQFVKLRLVQSYLLNREYEAANQTLESIDQQVLISQMTQDLYDILIAHRYAEPMETCTAIFNLFEYATYSAYNYNSFQDHIGTDLTVGVPRKFAGDFIGAGNPVNPSFGGCNIPDQIDKILERSFYPSDANTLIEQLQNKGFLVHDYIHADFDGDGNDDWLIWHEANVPAILYIINEVNQPLELSRVHIRQDSDQSLIETIPLPENSGVGIVKLRASQDLPPSAGRYTCGESATNLGRLNFWQYAENNLSSTINTTWCDDYTTIDSMFDEVDGKHIMYVRDPQNTGEVIVYTWDAESGRYMPPSEPEETASEPQSNFVAMPESTPSNEELHDLLGDGIRVYYLRLDEQVSNAGDIEAKIAILDTEINAPYMDYPYTLQYWKATILLNAGLEDEALAEFVAIYEAAPDSLWGKLAHLHFGEVEN